MIQACRNSDVYVIRFGAFARGLGRLAAAEVVNNCANVAGVDAALPLRSCGTDALNI